MTTYLESYLYITAGVVLILISVFFVAFLYVKSTKQKKGEEVRDIDKTITKIQKAAGGSKGLLGSGPCLPSQPSHGGSTSNKRTPAPNETTALLDDSGESQLLVFDREYFPVLRVNRSDREEIIYVDKPDFYIGRNEAVVDYCETGSPYISRVHAKVIFRKDTYFLVDLDSKGGTYLNGEKLVSEKPYPLCFGDKIQLADIEYVFDSEPSKTVEQER
ncbi:MAG: FHA domain-containing protein [Bacillota bacterium]|jgi:hypothetical protein|nr:FHA domain-containing protein [Bacillota bacterium]